jgi:hypothetical protein
MMASRLFENMGQFKYLGRTVTNENLIQEEIKRSPQPFVFSFAV